MYIEFLNEVFYEESILRKEIVKIMNYMLKVL